MFWSSGVDLPDDLEARIEDLTLDLIELPSGEKAFLSLHLPARLAPTRASISGAARQASMMACTLAAFLPQT